MPIPIQIRVYEIPGGEASSQHAFDELEDLLAAHSNLTLTIYRGYNRANGRWVLTLIGEPAAFVRYQAQIERPLMAVQATPLQVPPAALQPLIDRFEARRAEMRATGTPFMSRHFPLPKAAYARPNSKRLKQPKHKRH